MTSREKFLVVALLSSVTLVGGGLAFHLFFWKPYSTLRARRDLAQKDIATKMAERNSVEEEKQRAYALDPRLARWPDLSLADITSRDKDKLERRNDLDSAEYGKELSELLRRVGFQSPTGTPNINVQTEKADEKDVPTFSTKVPIYTRLTYKFKAKATFKSIVQMFQEFYLSEKLHVVRKFTLVNPTPVTSANRGTRGTRGTRGPGGVPGAPGAIPGVPGAPGAVPGVPMIPGLAGPGGENPGGVIPGGQGGEAQAGRGWRENAMLEVDMTIEVLIVTGAKPREARKKTEEKPALADKGGKKDAGKGKAPDRGADPLGEEDQEVPVQPLAPLPMSILAPSRDYQDMLFKNMYSGLQTKAQAEGRLSEKAQDVLRAVTLVMMEKIPNPKAGWFDHSHFWVAEFRDQGALKEADRNFRCNPDDKEQNSFEVRDKYKTSVLKGTVVDANLYGVILKVENMYYKMRLGDFLNDVLNPATDELGALRNPDHEPMEDYRRGDWKGPSMKAGKPQLAEEPSAILKDVKLIKSANGSRRWEVEFKDAARKKEYKCTPDFESLSGFEVKDRYNQVVVKGNVVDGHSAGVVLKIEDLFYKMKMGDSFDDVLNPARDVDKRIVDPQRAPMKTYTKGDWKEPETPPMKEEAKKGEEKKEAAK